MHTKLLIVLFLPAFTVWLCSASAIQCPSICSCYLDFRGRKAVSCNRGGMTNIPFREMESITEIIKISAPEYNLNSLAMDPNLQEFRNLEELHITRSNIPELGVRLFWTLKKLMVLNLSQNNITQPLDEGFRGLKSLTELYLDDNRIYSLPSGTFRYLTSLKILSLQRNRIHQMMPRMFEQLGKLQVLKLSGNYIQELNPESFKDVLRELRVFECQGCSLKKIDSDVYAYLPHLIDLEIGYNALESLSSDDFANLTTLKYLGLSGNKISEIKDEQFVYAKRLRKIKLSKNRIFRIREGAFLNLQNLTELDLGYNKLERLDKEWVEPIAKSLQKLSLSGNRASIPVLRSFLEAIPEIRDLQLADAGLFDIPEGLFPEKLSSLNLAGNSLAYLVPNAIPPTVLELDLSRNSFKGLSEALLEHVGFATNLTLVKNPWSCDLCHIVPMLERANKSAALREVTCHTPYIYEGQTLGSLQMSDLNWCTTSSFSSGANYFLMGNEDKIGIIAASASFVLLLMAVLAALGAFCYSRRHAAKYYTHEDKRTAESEAIFENQSAFFGDERELSFKFPVDVGDKKMAIATIDDELKKKPISNIT